MIAQKKMFFYSCNKVGLNEEIFHFLMIFLRKAFLIKRDGRNKHVLGKRPGTFRTRE